ncbi:hypothetical protein [Corynebacterium uterequi]|uniref:Uncharacterized protein n=1 Tax=Corynebacterium uterequi TaxID=1072256 RepID=A0A0G3HEG4_9CORY|nr:hypothetical protein [Corynebacterium uterequi]AKK11674.1 hypothetical protein CUTER_08455 [Corynebacterium uterequi]
MGITATSIVVAVLAGIGSYYSWNNNKPLSMILGIVTMLAGTVGAVGAFFHALGLIFKLLPILLMILGAWWVYTMFRSHSSTPKQ